jgi:hypothetical protein
MKNFKIITHPATIIVCFLLVLISGENWGGFFLMYILLGLPHGAIHSILAVTGIGILLFSYLKYKMQFIYMAESVLNIFGALLLFLSLFLFFYRDKDNYNIATFYQTVPLIIMSVFGLLLVIFLANNFINLFRKVAA